MWQAREHKKGLDISIAFVSELQFHCFMFRYIRIAPCVQYELKVTASDGLHETETDVVMHIRDLNDRPPVFDRGTYMANTIEEFAQPTRRILKVFCRDRLDRKRLRNSLCFRGFKGLTFYRWWWIH